MDLRRVDGAVSAEPDAADLNERTQEHSRPLFDLQSRHCADSTAIWQNSISAIRAVRPMGIEDGVRALNRVAGVPPKPKNDKPHKRN